MCKFCPFELAGVVAQLSSYFNHDGVKIGAKEALASRRHVYALLPRMSITDTLIEVDGWTGCLDAFTHQMTGRPEEREDKLKLAAAILRIGMNLGLSSMAESTPYTYRQLAWAADWHLREETLLATQVILDNFVLHQPFARSWGDGTASSSDGMRVKVGVGAANARKNAEHFGKKERGVTIYTHKADVYVPFYKPEVISPNDREALYVIDALLHHESDLKPQEHYTNTHGFTHHVFALCRLLGLRFAPRIADVLGQRLYVIDPLADYSPLKGRIKGKINPQRIRDHWQEFGRIAGSISHGTASAPLLMGKLAGYPQQNQVARALEELGKIEKTLFILDYLCDEQLRRRILEGLNKGEAVHSLARKIFFGRHGEFWEQTIEDQIHRASCLHFLIGVITAWNTEYVTKAVLALQGSRHPIPPEHLSHISPLGWEHINFIGKYGFDFRAVRPLDQFCPLRSEEEIAADASEESL